MEETITKEEVKNLLQKGFSVIILDVRSMEEYHDQHIPGALNISTDHLTDAIARFPKDVLLITVCGKGGGRSEAAARQLNDAGLKACYLEGGTFGWFE